MIKINISKDYTEIPGPRKEEQGEYSGEDFRKKILIPKFKECLESNEILEINFDGCYGYPTSFLEEAFGGLAREYKDVNVLEKLQFISDEEPALIEEVKDYILNANDK